MRKVKLTILAVVLFGSSLMLTGCIPPNENVGREAPHYYKDHSYYGDRYYY